MVTTHLIDTDVCIGALRRDATVASRFLRHDDTVAVSAITVSELHFGALRSSEPDRNLEAVAEFLAFLRVLALDDADARIAAEIRSELAAQGTPIGGYDLLIAGQARARSLVLATGNVREFGRVQRLRVEDWCRPGQETNPTS